MKHFHRILSLVLAVVLWDVPDIGDSGIGNGKKDSSGKWYYYNENGKKDTSYTGFASNSNGTWYVKDDKVDFSYSGTYRSGGFIYTIKK